MLASSLKFVGNTPIYQLDDTNIFVKLEKYNLGGSVKDRAVLGMLEEAKRQGKVNEDTIIVEPTSGNTGIAVAILASILGLKAVIIMPESMSLERRTLIKAYGAQLILTPKELGIKGSIELAEKLRGKYPNAISLSQFDNPANPAYHHKTTGKEILEQVPDIDIFVAGVGTGGTFSGVAKYLKENKPGVLAVALEPEESPAISKGHGGVHKIQGIGTGFVPENFDKELMDEVYTVSSEEAIEATKDFVRTTGIGVGISSGAAIAGAKKVAAKYPDKKIVTILPDGVDKYLSMLDFEEVTYVEV
ncbi:cysteine synthase A [Gemella sanguinis]|jgi:cysteine synthase A|uniref:cysteine synthase n=1 Tax=Gemella sanguinis TaxID=84135 RepID=A0A2N6SFM3_9BACL|nr:cysteine synthase A [Gemella sanguinis]EGF88931.1 cysteine synthase [Gemella sanguinis M325]PMC52710.1 cysteine synthase A [Gemella sanguinis]QGS07732.1 cysteine synthase A [Gemella sanguinis]